MKNVLAIAALIALSGQAHAAPLEFFSITADTVPENSSEFECNTTLNPPICKIARETFSSILIEESLVFTNPHTGKIRGLTIFFSSFSAERAIEALSAKYGDPTSDLTYDSTNETGGPEKTRYVRWTSFTDGSNLTLSSSSDGSSLRFTFAANEAPPASPQVDF